MKESLKLKITINAKPAEIYETWLDTVGHSKMTGGEAECGKGIGDSFSAWDGYISGKNVELTPNKKIVQTWRTSEFNENDEDSTLEILLSEKENGTEITIIHNNIPEGQTQYEQGWKDHYFEPMKNYFKS